MRISITGVGQVGRVVERLGMAACHPAMVSNICKSASLSDALSGSIACEAGNNEGVVTFGDVAVIATPMKQTIPAAPLAGKPVLDATKHLPEWDSHMGKLNAHRATTGGLPARHLPESWRFECAKSACCCLPDRASLVHKLALARRDVGLAGMLWRS